MGMLLNPYRYATVGDLGLVNIALTNPGAETGDTTGWTQRVNSLPGIKTDGNAHSGANYFSGAAAAASSAWDQEVTLDSSLHTAIDAGGCILIGRAWHTGFTDADNGALYVECYDNTPTLLGRAENAKTDPGGASGPAGQWAQEICAVSVPTGTRKVRIGTENVRVTGTELSAYWDDFELDINTSPDTPALTITAGSAATPTNNASITPTNPTHQSGDRLLCIVISRGSGSTPVTAISCATSGWATPNGISSLINLGSTRRMALFENQCDSASESNPAITFTGGAAGNTCCAIVIRLRNSNFANDFVLGSVSSNASGNTIPFAVNSPSIDDGNGILAIGFHNNAPSSGDFNVIADVAEGLTWSQILEQQTVTGDDATFVINRAINNLGVPYFTGNVGVLSGATFTVNNTSGGVYLEIPGA